MEISEKYGFKLPSSDGEDVADINDLSDNFKKIEERVMDIQDIKENDFKLVSNIFSPILVDDVDEMINPSQVYVLKSNGQIYIYKNVQSEIAEESLIELNITHGIKLDKSTGTESSANNYGASSEIPYEPDKVYVYATTNNYVASGGVCWYNGNTYLGYTDALSGGTIGSPEAKETILTPIDGATHFRLRVYASMANGTDYTVLRLTEISTQTIETYRFINTGLKYVGVETDASKILFGKKVVCFGDSLFGMYRDETSVTSHIENITSATVYNVGFGGCRMSTHPTSGYNEFCMYALADAVVSGNWSLQDGAVASGASYFPEQLALVKSIDFNDIDIAVIHYGTNDFMGGVSLDDDLDKKSTDTVCGSLRYSIESLLTVFPNILLYVSLPVFRYWEEDGVKTYSNTYIKNGKTLPQFCEAIASVAREYNLPIIDGYSALGINEFNAETFLLDGTHHTEIGRKRFGEYIGKCLMSGI